MSPRACGIRIGGPALLMGAAVYMVVVLLQVLPFTILLPVRSTTERLTEPYWTQSWKFFAPEPAWEDWKAVLRIRGLKNGELVEMPSMPLSELLIERYRSRPTAPPRLIEMTGRLERQLWFPDSPWRKVYERVLSGVAAGQQGRWGMPATLEIRGEVRSKPIPASAEAFQGRERLVADTGWLRLHTDVERVCLVDRVTSLTASQSGGTD